MIALLSLALLTATPAAPSEPSRDALKDTAAFEEWLAGRYLLEERWFQLPAANLVVGYFLAPAPLEAVEGAHPFDDAFIAFDTRTGQPIAPAQGRTEVPGNGCPEPGKVAGISVGAAAPTSADLRFGVGRQRCELQLQRTKGAWSASLFPNEEKSPAEVFPKAAAALAKVLAAADAGTPRLEWSYLARSPWLIAAAAEGCRVWVVDSLTHHVDVARSRSMTEQLCGCREMVLGPASAS